MQILFCTHLYINKNAGCCSTALLALETLVKSFLASFVLFSYSSYDPLHMHMRLTNTLIKCSSTTHIFLILRFNTHSSLSHKTKFSKILLLSLTTSIIKKKKLYKINFKTNCKLISNNNFFICNKKNICSFAAFASYILDKQHSCSLSLL